MINKELLQEMIEKKYISVQKHPEADLYIYNYTQNAQFERVWNEITLMCRGLILDVNMNIVALPFKKFFNYEEHSVEDIPVGDFEAYEKMDGSLGILYHLDNVPHIATRGSFTSDQAVVGNKILNKNYYNLFEKLNKDYTYL